MRLLVLVFIGGGIGSMARYLFGKLVLLHFSGSFPLGTLLVNIFGCFLIGIFLTLPEKYLGFSIYLKLFLATGFCGGFTTFSSFAYENNLLIHNKEFFYFLLYSTLSFFLGLSATWVGILLVKKLF